jgi:hypothetical protein
MYLEIMTLGSGENSLAESRVFVGPFDSEGARDLFREHWERQLNSPNHNQHQVKFLSCEKLPDDWGAVVPRDFRGFTRIPFDPQEPQSD